MISHFLFPIFISKYIASTCMFSLCEFSCLDAILSLTYKQRPPPKQFLCQNILYPFIENWSLGKELSIFVSEIRKISNVFSIIFCVVSNLFLRELMLNFLEYSGGNVWVLWNNCLCQLKSVELKWYYLIFCYVYLQKQFFSIISIDIILFQYNFKNSLSAVYHHSFLSVDLLHWYDDGNWCWSVRSNQSCFLHILLSRKCLLLLLLHLTYLFLVLGLILLPCFYQF